MPAPAPVVKKAVAPVPKGPAPTQPLVVNAAEEGPKVTAPPAPVPPPVEEAPEVPAEAKGALAAMSVPWTENADGSITVDLEFPVQHGFPVLPNPLPQITLKRAQWKFRRKAAQRVGPSPSAIDNDTALISELSGIPEPVLDEMDSRDMSILQVVLGKLLFSQRLT